MMHAVTRTLAFFSKWMAEVVRQPALMVSLIAGPFLVLLAFGQGVDVGGIRPRIIVVEPATNTGPMQPLPDELNDHVKLVATTQDLSWAQDQLRKGKVDAVGVIPPDPLKTVEQGQHVPIQIYTNDIDPVTRSYAELYLNQQVAELNRKTIEKAITEAQGSAKDIRQVVQQARPIVETLQNNQGGVDTALSQVQRLQQLVDPLPSAVNAANNALQGVSFVVPGLNTAANQVQRLSQATTDLKQGLDRLNQTLQSGQGLASATDMDRVAKNLDEIDKTAGEVLAIPPDVLASPFELHLENVAPYVPGFTAFYSPAVLALIIQHLAITLGALSMTRIRLLGLMDLLRVSPVRPREVVVGNYLSYGVLCAVAAAALSALVIGVLNVPVFGAYWELVLGVALLITVSLGIGFVVSLISTSEQQAAQIAMLILLASIFFSGFVFSLDKIGWPVRALSYALPSTYAMRSLQDVMLRGVLRQPADFAILAAAGLVFFVATLGLFRREFRPA